MDKLPDSGFLPEKPRFSLSTRITVIVFWCLALVGLACSIFLLKDVEQDVLQDRQAVIERFSYRVEQTLFDVLSRRGPPDLTRKLESLALRFGVEGVVLRWNDQELAVGKSGAGFEGTTRNLHPERSGEFRRIPAATLTLYFPPVKEIVNGRRDRVMFAMGMLFLLLGIALQRLLTRVLTRPLRNMVTIAQAVSEGEMGRRFDDSTGDEFGYLGGFINQALGELSYQASHDPVTGLYNRREFRRILHRALQTAQRDGQCHALCYLDLDRFKLINDTCGHSAGDEFLAQLAAHLRRSMRKSDVLARLGGDEFAVLLQHCPIARAEKVAGELHQAIQDFRFVWEHKCFHVGVSIGLVAIVGTSHSVVQLMNHADLACHAAKRAGRNRLHVYHHSDAEVTRCRGETAMVSQLTNALEEDRLRLYYQPIRAIAEHREPDRHELLLRLLDNDGRLLEPEHFVPTAERFDIMPALDRWVIEQACRFLSHRPDHDWNPALMVNISGKSLGDETFPDFVVETISQCHVNPEGLCFEMIEAAAIANLPVTRRFMEQLHAMGCHFALDDFGSGVSSFAYLKNLPVDYLKIDGSFVRNIADSEVDRAMVEAMNRVGHVLGMKTIAEFVDQAAVFDILREIGVDYAQGYWLAEPRPLEELSDAGEADAGLETLLHGSGYSVS